MLLSLVCLLRRSTIQMARKCHAANYSFSAIACSNCRVSSRRSISLEPSFEPLADSPLNHTGNSSNNILAGDLDPVSRPTPEGARYEKIRWCQKEPVFILPIDPITYLCFQGSASVSVMAKKPAERCVMVKSLQSGGETSRSQPKERYLVLPSNQRQHSLPWKFLGRSDR